ncbi:DUF4214 domain-containing protein [Pseudomonas sp. NPDC090202]|uniref:DUF4214 domain-containing protein n=1 Tax=unclassified Pseudomonas TaxID=196821 RepID=UPI0037FC380F
MAASAYLNAIQTIYIAYLGRPADPDGLAYWANQADAQGGDLSSIISGFSDAAESQALYNGQTTDEVISAIYGNLFNRTPDDAGLQYWKAQISEGKVSLAQAAQAIVNGALNSDATSVANKLIIANAFTAQIDTAAEISGYAGSASFDYARSFLKTVGADPASVTAANAALADAVVTATNTGGSGGTPGEIFTLTAGIDNFTGTDRDDTFTSTVAGGFGTGDSINGGSGSDKLVVNDPGSIVAPNVAVTNVESASFTTVGALELDTTTWTGLTTLTTNVTNAHTTLVVGNSTAVKVTSTANTPVFTDNTISVTGGNSVDITNAANNVITPTAGTVNVTGGVNGVSVKITDANAVGQIRDIYIANYLSLQVKDNALSYLSLTTGGGDITIDNSSSSTPNPSTTTLYLTLNGVTGGKLDDSDVYTTLNVFNTGADSTLTNIVDSALTTLNVTGNHALTLASTAGMSALETVKVTGQAGLNANLAGASVTSVDASTTSGDLNVTLDATKASYSGGNGNDHVTLTGTAAATHVVTGGSGQDELTIDAGAAASTADSLISGFESVTFTGATAQTIDVSHFAGTHAFLTSGGNGLTLDNLSNDDGLILTGAGSAYELNGADFSGTNDSLNLALINNTGASIAYATTGVTASDVENIEIGSVDTGSSPSGNYNNTLTLNDTSLKNVTVTGNAGLTLTTDSTDLINVDASALTQGGFTWSSGTLTGTGITVRGSATGTNNLDIDTDGGTLDYHGGAGADTLTLKGNGAATLDFGNGQDTLVLENTSTSTAFTTISGFSQDLDVDFSQTTGATPLTTQTAFSAAVTGPDFATLLNTAAAADATLSTSLKWFQFGGDTYIVHDVSADNTFVEGTDTLIKLVGTYNLNDAQFSITDGVVHLSQASV